MPTFDFTSPEGKTYSIDGPEGSTKEQAFQMLQTHLGGAKPATAQKEPSFLDRIVQTNKNIGGGLLRGAGSIGATAMRLLPNALGGDTAEQNTERRNAMDSALSNMGADTNSLGYGASKLGAEIAGTAGAGGALGNIVGRGAQAFGLGTKAAPLVNALTSSGMTTGAKLAPNAAWLGAKGGELALRTGAGAAVGAGSAAATGDSALDGGVVGGILPGALKGIGAVGSALGAGAKKLYTAVSETGAQSEATKKILNSLSPEDAKQAIVDIQLYYPKMAENIPVSMAGMTKNPAIARLEQGSRLKSPEAWYGFDQAQGKAVSENMLRATKEADDIGAIAAKRRENWGANWEKVADSKKPRVYNKLMGDLGPNIETALMSPEASNPAVKNVLEAFKNEVIRVGKDFDLGHLQQVRANLNGRSNPMSPNAFQAAPRDSAAVKSIIQEMDDILNKSTGNKFDNVLQGYAKDTTELHAAKAASKVRDSFFDQSTGRVRGVSLDANGDVPKITEAGLGRAMDAARKPGTKDLALNAQANDRLMATIEVLRNQNIVQGVKRSSTAGGGSDSASNFTAIIPGGVAKNTLMQLLEIARGAGNAKTDRHLAELLANPNKSKDIIEKAMQKNPSKVSQILGSEKLNQLLYKAAPVAIAQ
jgi:hypothetical protein